MKLLSRPTLTLFVIVFIGSFTACTQQPIIPPTPANDKPYYDEAYGFFDSTRLITNLVTGTWENNYCIKASGTAINMKRINSLIAFSISHNTGLLTGKGASVNTVFKTELAATKYSNLADNIHHIIFDDDGNSLWLQINNITMSLSNPLLPVFNGESTVKGGTGKFANSGGLIYFTGQLDVTHPYNSMIRTEGTVKY